MDEDTHPLFLFLPLRKFFLLLLTLQSMAFVALAQVQTSGPQADSAKQAQTEAYLKELLKESKDQTQSTRRDFEAIEIDQIIVDQMISKAGNDFFDFFTADFEWPESQQNFIIVVSERPFFAGNTLMVIKVNDLEVFQNILQPRTSFLEELADYAQAVTLQYIINYQQIISDLEGADRSGSGIY